MSNYPKGSEWRRWDLHVHAPKTKLSNAYSGYDDILGEFANRIENCSADVVAITDYFSIDGYEEFMDKFKEYYPDSHKVIFANVEFRLSETIGESGTHPHLHIIFDVGTFGCSVREVRDFLGRLELYDKGAHGQPLYCSSLQSQPEFEAASVTKDNVLKALNATFGENKPYLIAFPANNDGVRSTIGSPRNILISDELDRSSDLFFGKMDNRDYFLGENRYESGISEAKPVVSGSDAHSFEELERIDNQQEGFEFTWIKADPTFEGLRQIIREPEDRVFIGEKPPKLKQDESNPTKIIGRVRIAPVNPTGNDGWFDNNELCFNSGLIAIIGNKGSGKSALADILALAGNSKCDPDDYSFLIPNKFRKSGLAEKFETELTWRDGNHKTINLNKNNNAEVEQVIYLPQSQLEKICAEPNSDSFQQELERVIFSRLDESQKRGHENFRDLIDDRDKGHQEKIGALRRQISAANKKIVEYENYLSDDFRTRKESNLEEKNRELEAHEKNKPEEVEPPTPDDSTAEAQNKVGQKSKELEELRAEIASLRSESAEVENQITITRNLIKRLENFAESFDRLKTETEEGFNKIGVAFDSVIKLEHTLEPLEIKLSELQTRKNEIANQLNLDKDDTLLTREKKLQTELEKLQTDLNKPAQDYQKYLMATQGWEKQKLEIEGEGDKPAAGTIKNLEQWLNYIRDSAPNILNQEKEKRRKLSSDILTELNAIINDRDELYRPVKEMIARQAVVKDGFGFGFDSQISDKGFVDRFLEYINKGASGSFYGVDESKELLSGLMNGVDFRDAEQVMGLLEEIDHHLHHDMRPDRDESPNPVVGQLTRRTTIEELYDFIWSLDYLEPELALKLDKKPVGQLSPGERGSLLLVFYLLLDENRIPIIVDQPEENLDNQTVYNLLVPIIKQAKQQRQVIMVTHNPNIAVVCDAEQIIHSDIDKAANNKVDYTSGAIEAPELNKHLVDVLEGTKPAFDNRREKYIEK